MQNDAAPMSSTIPAHVYEVRPRKDKRRVNLIPMRCHFGRLCYAEPNAMSNAIDLRETSQSVTIAL